MNKIQKNIEDKKAPQGSFESIEKEPFRERLKSLLAGRSVNQAARDWGVNLSTLKNYFSRQGSTPRHEVLLKISSHEGVSVDWLLYGDLNESAHENPRPMPIDDTPLEGGLSRSALKIASLLDLLENEDIDALSKILALKGVETILYLLDEDNIALLRLDKVVKEKILGKQPKTEEVASQNYEKAKECGADNAERPAEESLASDNKRQAV
ncbi:hypothetical protein ACEV6Q_06895 [Enterobacter ludwigii]|uniref:hypothetical protein n=1 Tax=Enterobacter ludwigii TaxID=299767 RepID=UPI003BEEED6D